MDLTQVTAAQAVDLQAIQGSSAAQGEYRIGVSDKLNVVVFQVAELSAEEIVVDTAGNIQLPLIGTVRVAEQTAAEASADIARRLAHQYLRDPRVTVTVVEAANQKITVDGAVGKPGVYVMRGNTSLLQAIAMAEGANVVADLTKVAVFRDIEGQRSVALFDLQAIRQGRAADPAVLGDDIIIVDSSRRKTLLREVIAALPALSVFRPY